MTFWLQIIMMMVGNMIEPSGKWHIEKILN